MVYPALDIRDNCSLVLGMFNSNFYFEKCVNQVSKGKHVIPCGTLHDSVRDTKISVAAGFGGSSLAGGGGGGGGGGADAMPPSMQLRHFLSTHPSMSCSPDPPKCRPPQSRAMIPAMTPMIVMTANTTTSVSIEWCVLEWLGSTSTSTGGGSTSGGS